MTKLWAKLVNKRKILKETIFPLTEDESINLEAFKEGLTKICGQFDLSVPLLLPSHLKELFSFSRVVFRHSDFLESVNFDQLEIIVFTDKKKNTLS